MPESPQLDVGYVAQLARLDLTAAETQRFQTQLAGVLDYVNQLRAVDVTGVEETAHAIPLFNVFREDEARLCFTAAEALSNAPRQANGLFILTKVVE